MAFKILYSKLTFLFEALCRKVFEAIRPLSYRNFGLRHSGVPNDVQITMQTGGGVERGDRTVTIEIRNMGRKDVFVENIAIVAPEHGARLCAYGRHRLGHRALDAASATLVIDTGTWMVPPGRTEWKIVEVRVSANVDAAEVELSLGYHHGDSRASTRVLHKVGPNGDP